MEWWGSWDFCRARRYCGDKKDVQQSGNLFMSLGRWSLQGQLGSKTPLVYLWVWNWVWVHWCTNKLSWHYFLKNNFCSVSMPVPLVLFVTTNPMSLWCYLPLTCFYWLKSNHFSEAPFHKERYFQQPSADGQITASLEGTFLWICFFLFVIQAISPKFDHCTDVRILWTVHQINLCFGAMPVQVVVPHPISIVI